MLVLTPLACSSWRNDQNTGVRGERVPPTCLSSPRLPWPDPVQPQATKTYVHFSVLLFLGLSAGCDGFTKCSLEGLHSATINSCVPISLHPFSSTKTQPPPKWTCPSLPGSGLHQHTMESEDRWKYNLNCDVIWAPSLVLPVVSIGSSHQRHIWLSRPLIPKNAHFPPQRVDWAHRLTWQTLNPQLRSSSISCPNHITCKKHRKILLYELIRGITLGTEKSTNNTGICGTSWHKFHHVLFLMASVVSSLDGCE